MKTTDFLVIGSGIAGLSFALDAAELGKVTVLCKTNPQEGNTQYAQGGIASVTSPEDSIAAHVSDTISCGAGMCREEIVNITVTEAPAAIARLAQFGAHFDRQQGSGEYELGQEGGHSIRRILHAGDKTGAEILRALLLQASQHPNIEILPYFLGTDLITRRLPDDRREVLGAYALNQENGHIETFVARVTFLATGGTGKVYLYTSNPDVATGDGIAMAYRAGANIANMEFIQFHPTCLYHPKAKSFLITEAMRGEGAKLLTMRGEPFVHHYDSRGELAPRDIVARAIDDVMKKSGDECVLLDISHRDAEFIKARFPTIYARTKELGFDITSGPIPVVPAAHYSCGGVLTDEHGQTSLPRLYCAGETACTGLHGANRLASNSLLEAVVFATRAAKHVRSAFKDLTAPTSVKEWDNLDTVKSTEQVLVSFAWDEVRKVMWDLVGIVRSDKRLALARRRIALIKEEVHDYYWKFLVTADLLELRNIVQVAELIIVSAASRRESRGLHYNLDCPARDDAKWQHDTVLALGTDGLPELEPFQFSPEKPEPLLKNHKGNAKKGKML